MEKIKFNNIHRVNVEENRRNEQKMNKKWTKNERSTLPSIPKAGGVFQPERPKTREIKQSDWTLDGWIYQFHECFLFSCHFWEYTYILPDFHPNTPHICIWHSLSVSWILAIVECLVCCCCILWAMWRTIWEMCAKCRANNEIKRNNNKNNNNKQIGKKKWRIWKLARHRQ